MSYSQLFHIVSWTTPNLATSLKAKSVQDNLELTVKAHFFFLDLMGLFIRWANYIWYKHKL